MRIKVFIAVISIIFCSTVIASDIKIRANSLGFLNEIEIYNSEDSYILPEIFLDTAELDSFILDQMESYHIPGASACAIKDGEIFWTGKYGLANMEDNITVTDSTTFMLCSVSKTVVGVALMQLYEDGYFGLDDNIELYLPFEIDNPMCPGINITFRMLMTHTSSIRDNWDVLYPLTVPGDSPVPLDYFMEEYLLPDGIYYNTANFNNWCPGEQENYTNVGIALGALLVEIINPYGLSFDQYCDMFIFAPLEMHDTSWYLSGMNIDNIAIPYMYYDNMYHRWPHYGNPVYPAGFLRSNSTHLARHLIAFMQHGIIDSVRILDSTTVELMTTVQINNRGLVWHRLYSNGRLLWGHNGSSWGAGTKMFYCPDENTGVIVLTNRDANNGTIAIMDALFEFASQHTGIDTEDNTPNIISMKQNYPNPFNAWTTIQYSLSEQSHVVIDIYDILGKRVKTITHAKQRAGDHKLIWNAKNQSSGIYFYRIQASDYSETKKMLLLR
ncbi:MAG: serine hydrolase [candidate division Zixibacteria bacterium]